MTLDNKEVEEEDGERHYRPTTEYLEVCKRLGLECYAVQGTDSDFTWAGPQGHDSALRDDTGERGGHTDGVVSYPDDPGMDAPPNIIEVEGGPYPRATWFFEDYLYDDGGKYMGDSTEPEYSDSDELGGVKADGKSDGCGKTALHGE